MNDQTSEAIAQRAYHLFLSRGASHGRDVDDWLEAERELSNGNGYSALPRAQKSAPKARSVKSRSRRRAS